MNPPCASPPLSTSSEAVDAPGPLPAGDVALPAIPATYGPVFWWCYLSNSATMVAVSLLFRYGDFVAHLGGKEGQLGLIVGVGMVGSLLMRLVQGVAIDLYGSRRIWLISQTAFIVSLFGHLLADNASGPLLYLLRVLFSTSVAGIFGASVTFISRRAPANRVAEVIGSLGTSGFLAMLVGPQLGDWICGSDPIGRPQIQAMFLTAAGMGIISLIAAVAATSRQPRIIRRRVPPVWQVLRKYQPGAILLAAVAMGVGVGMPHTFLRMYAAELHLPRIGVFFSVYAVTAFLTRLATARLPNKVGVRPMITVGLAFLAFSMILYLPVRTSWHFAFPALAAGIAHALLFPAVVGGGSTSFPERYRGVGTTLMMGMFDLGVFLGAPAIGGAIHLAKDAGLPAYPSVFLMLFAGLLGVGLAYFWKSRDDSPSSSRSRGVAA